MAGRRNYATSQSMVQENTRGADLKIGAAFLLPDRISGCISIAEVKPGSRTNIRSFNGPALLAVVCGGPFSRTAREISARRQHKPGRNAPTDRNGNQLPALINQPF
jgi:hypothetical protein